ncbi:hypothetical protein Sjap_006706 [Stephania japonica]|uniref:Uncharacterized protein n=1 Tax=Stephania japonica TaxID=461633 RepID=A0AAP0K6B8_9MAGN
MGLKPETFERKISFRHEPQVLSRAPTWMTTASDLNLKEVSVAIKNFFLFWFLVIVVIKGLGYDLFINLDLVCNNYLSIFITFNNFC